MEELTIQGLGDLPAAAAALLVHAGERRKFVFSGEIGAGKTTLIQTICQQLGVTDWVTSPTFALVNVYQGEIAGQSFPVHHLDLYRLRNYEEALDIGIEDYLYDEHYCLIEWPEIVEELLPPEVVRIKLEILPDSGRKMLFL